MPSGVGITGSGIPSEGEMLVRRFTPVASAAVVAALVVGACGSGTSPDRASTQSAVVPPPTATSTAPGPSPTPVPPGRIAFGTFDPDIDEFRIYTARPDGSDVKQLLPDGHEIPVWSPDYTEIAVTGGAAKVFATIVKADGSSPRALKLADATLSLACTAWSPDGKQCAAEGWDATTPGREGVYLVDLADDSPPRRLTSPTGGIHDSPASFSPDGKQLLYVHLYSEGGELRAINVDGTGLKKVGDQLVHGAAFSPDGRSIAAATTHSVLIFEVADLSAPPKVVSLPPKYDVNDGPNWSPDGTRFVLGLFQPGINQPNVYTMQIDGTDLWPVTHTVEESSFGTWGLPPG
jgi:Tol biopolymer transport system component